MSNEALQESIVQLFPSAEFDGTGEFLTVTISAAEFYPLMNTLSKDEAFQFNYLFCLTCIDWKTHLMMVYHLLSRTHRHNLVVKVKLSDCENPSIDSITSLWKTAEFHEREVFDLFGVHFNNHPDLRRLLLDENWDGFPLRKNYVDENMIAL